MKNQTVQNHVPNSWRQMIDSETNRLKDSLHLATVSATLFVFMKIADFSALGIEFSKNVNAYFLKAPICNKQQLHYLQERPLK